MTSPLPLLTEPKRIQFKEFQCFSVGILLFNEMNLSHEAVDQDFNLHFKILFGKFVHHFLDDTSLLLKQRKDYQCTLNQFASILRSSLS